MKEKDIVETPYLKMWMEENILYAVYTKNLDLTINVAKQCVSERIAFSEGVSRVCIFDVTGVKSVTKEAREYLASEGAMYIKAGALLIKSALTRMLGNIFLLINKPYVPTKLFTDIKDAKEWLKQFAAD